MELNVGDYVRTKYGIAKIIDNEKNPYKEKTIFVLDKEIPIEDLELSNMYFTTNMFADNATNKIDTYFGDEKIILKSSPNIIDLIEVGDYVNDYYVEDITNTGKELVLHIITGSNYFQSLFLYNEDIKSVLTHEQFEAMQYVVGDTNVKD